MRSTKATQSTKNNRWFVYLLKCEDGTYYTGCTNNLDDRINRHNLKQVFYTSTRLPVQLVTYIAFANRYKAYDFEKYLKSGSGKAFAKKRFFNMLLALRSFTVEELSTNVNITKLNPDTTQRDILFSFPYPVASF